MVVCDRGRFDCSIYCEVEEEIVKYKKKEGFKMKQRQSNPNKMKIHSPKFEDIKSLWDTGRWPLLYIHWQVDSGNITEKEFEEITGTKFRLY